MRTRKIADRSWVDIHKCIAKAAPGWDHYRTFLEVARDGSLSGAARRLGLTQPTAGRHIDGLEAALGVSLFLRSRRGLEPTAAARELLPHAEAMAASHNALVRAASGDAGCEAGSVRLTASEIMSTEVLQAILAPFCMLHPRLTVELVSSNTMQNLLRRDCDIAVRMARPDQDAIVAQQIGVTKIGLYAHRSYIAACGTPATFDELKKHRVIGFDRDDLAYRSAIDTLGAISPEDFGYRCDSDVAQLAAIRAGVGIGGCQHAIAERCPNLIAVLPDAFELNLEIWLAMHEKLASVRRVRLMFDALRDGLTSYIRQGLR